MTTPEPLPLPSGIRRTCELAVLTLALALTGPLMRRADHWEERTIRVVQNRRTAHADRATRAVSQGSDVAASIGHGFILSAALARPGNRTHAAAPAIALLTETAATLAIGSVARRRRPAVPHLDREQHTSAFPSGHQGATVALSVLYWTLAGRITSPVLRRTVRLTCLGWPATLGFSRVYVGLHYPSDIAAGTLIGLASGRLASLLLGSSPGATRTEPAPPYGP